MRSSTRALAAVLAAAVFAAPAVVRAEDPARSADLVLRVARLHVGDGRVLAPAVVVVDDGVIVRVQEGGALPAGAEVRDLRDAVACPGLVDAASQVGLDGGAAEVVDALTPDVRAVDAFDVRSRDLPALLRRGVTTLGILPAPSNLAAGSSAVATLRADGAAEIVVRTGAPVFAFRAPALRGDRVPNTVAGARALLDEAFRGRAWSTPGEGAVPVRPVALEMLAAMRAGPAIAHVSDAEEARVATSTLRGRGLAPVLVGLGGAWDDPASLAALGVPLVVTDLSVDDREGLLRLPGRLAAAGADVSLASDTSGKPLRMALALAVAHGLPAADAVPAVTSRPARLLGVGDRVGTVAEGLRADLLVLDGEPWEPSSRVLLQIAGGVVVEDAEAAR